MLRIYASAVFFVWPYRRFSGFAAMLDPAIFEDSRETVECHGPGLAPSRRDPEVRHFFLEIFSAGAVRCDCGVCWCWCCCCW